MKAGLETVCGPRLTSNYMFICWLTRPHYGPHFTMDLYLDGPLAHVTDPLVISHDGSLVSEYDLPYEMVLEAVDNFMEYANAS